MSVVSTKIVLDAGPAMAVDLLGYADELDAQPDIELVLPEPVAVELARKPGMPGASMAERSRREPVPAADLAALRRERGSGPMLGAGELGVIAISERVRVDPVGGEVVAVIDDRRARIFATERWGSDKALTGTLGLLYLVHERGLAARTLEQDIALIRKAGHRISPTHVEMFIARLTGR